MPKRGSSSRGRGGKAAGGAAKRKRDASEAENVAGIQKRRTDAKSREEGVQWEKQYYQGVGIEDLGGIGCGFCGLITPKIPFQAPFTGDGNIEVMSGLGGPGDGSIRLCGPPDYWDHDMGAIFMVPLRHIEQIFVLPSLSTPGEEAHEVVIVPTGATGASSIKREYPQIISFKWPDKPVDEALKRKNSSKTYEENDTYLSVLKRVLDKELESFDKAVIDLTAGLGDGLVIGNSVLSPPTESHMKSKANGECHLNFLNQGILFTSETQRVYMTFPSLDSVMVIRAKGEKDKIVGLNVICRAKEPFYDDGEGGATLINFGQMDPSLLDDIKGYLKKHDLKMMLCEQAFYDYENNVPATGWMPLMG